MATNTAGSSGYKRSNDYGPYIMKKRILFADWTGTNNDRHVVGTLPPYSVVIAAFSHVIVKTAFDDATGDDLDIGVTGSDDDLFASALDLNTGDGVLLTLDDLADANRYSTTEREVTCNFTTAPDDTGTTGEAYIYIGYLMADTGAS